MWKIKTTETRQGIATYTGRREVVPESSLKRYHLYNAAGQTVRLQSTCNQAVS